MEEDVRNLVPTFGEKARALLVAEKLRETMHQGKPVLIKNRNYHLRTYNNCFVGSEVVDWLLRQGEVPDRNTAVQCMRKLQSFNIIHHVCDDHLYKDAMLFYRFRKDDGTFPMDKDSSILFRGKMMYHSLKTSKGQSVLGVKTHNNLQYPDAFLGVDMLTWLVKEKEVQSRHEAVSICREMLERNIIRHVSDDHHFKDGQYLYQFKQDFTRQYRLSEVLTPVEPILPRSPSRRGSVSSERTNSTSSVGTPKKASFFIGADEDESKERSGSFGSPGAGNSSVLLRPVTLDELRNNQGRYTQKHIRIVSDAVGYGMVVRGDGPTYIQTVDPGGPAAAAGIKVRQFVKAVNGTDVLELGHQEVAKYILANQDVCNLVVLQHGRML
ncbi:DEP domain-containing mTOR-interacting protein-like [Branchiostoma floridae x Branchiostoma belcheri]